MNNSNSLIDRKTDYGSFRRLAIKRTNHAIRYIRLIGNLSNRSNYLYKPQGVKKIFAEIRHELDEVEKLFTRHQPKPFILE